MRDDYSVEYKELGDNEIYIETGEYKTNRFSSEKTFISALSPARNLFQDSEHPMETIGRVTKRRVLMQRGTTGSLSGTQYIIQSYPSYIKFWTIASILGKRTASITVHLELNNHYPMIELVGMNGVGRFIGRAKVITATINTSSESPKKASLKYLTDTLGYRILRKEQVQSKTTGVPPSALFKRRIVRK